MLFSSVPFLFYFLPAVLLVYFLVPKRAKNGVLLLSSLVFYGWGEPRYLPVMLVSILQGYIFGRLIERFRDTRRAKLFLVLSVLLSLGTLAYFKYADFMIANLNALTGLSAPLLRLALPVGISFYTFQILSYTVDVYRGTVPAQRNFIDLAAYIAMFPQLIAGPIVRYSDIAVQLKTREHSVSEAASGARRFILGLAKKILLANLLGELVSSFRASADLSVLYYWLGAIAFTLQIYYDFSGYSDMAIGLGRIFGFRFPENFQYPYLSGSITEFWRRWHISLGSWFRDYLYIPLGGNRKGSARQLLNILLVWLATGLWHGAAWNFVLWGLLYAVLLTAEKLFLLRGLQNAARAEPRLCTPVCDARLRTVRRIQRAGRRAVHPRHVRRRGPAAGQCGKPVRAAQLHRAAPACRCRRNAACEKPVCSSPAQPSRKNGACGSGAGRSDRASGCLCGLLG